jgi:predicted transcriptional regulator
MTHFIISNSNRSTIKEISKKTGIKPEYIESMLALLSDLGIIDEEHGRYYIDEERGRFYELMFEKLIRSLEMLRGLDSKWLTSTPP